MAEARAAIAFDQPKLRAVPRDESVRISGKYVLTESGAASNPNGPLAEFDLEIDVPNRYPRAEPKVFEVGGRISRHPERHINADGDCCITVWEHWLANTEDRSFAAFLKGPVHQFFLGQYWYEKTGKWPFGEHAHGEKGLEEAYADVLGIPNNANKLIYYLRLLSQSWPKGHWLCPCGSGKKLRYCHQSELLALHRRIPPGLARRMLRRLKFYKTTLARR